MQNKVVFFLLSFLLGVFFTIFLQGLQNKRDLLNENEVEKKEIQTAKRLDAAAADSSVSVRNNVIKSESRDRELQIKKHFQNERKTINSLSDSLLILIEFERMVTRLKNKHR